MNILDRLHHQRIQITLEQKIVDTFGPNTCQSLTLTSNVTGDKLDLTCDRKRCVDCGPRKKALIQHQLQEAIGTHAYIMRLDTQEELSRTIERTKKRAQRTGEELLYQSVGDSTLGYILVSNQPAEYGQRQTSVDDWMRRILDMYHHSVQRIRRSYALGRVSLVTLYRKSKSGQQSPWYLRTVTTEGWAAVQELDWDTMLAETEWKEDVLLVHKPGLSLPIPF